MSIRAIVVGGALFVAMLSASAHATYQPSGATNVSTKHSGSAGSTQVAQVCGWFAISVCSTTFRKAQRAVNRWGEGYVVDTSSSEYPNFAPGYFCAVSGPKSRGAAMATARNMRRAGISSSAYAKSSC